MKVQSGNDYQARVMGGNLAGYTGTATATTATSLTGGTETGPTHAAGDVIGQTIITSTGTGSTTVYGLITANTSGTAPVYTVDRWYTAASPGGAAAATPATTAVYIVLPGGLPAWYMGLGSTNVAPAVGDTTMAGEITTAGGGLIRKICPYAHTAGAASYTLTPVFTANGTDSLPITVYRIGVFNSLTSGQLVFETTLTPASATLSASGDQLTITETVSL